MVNTDNISFDITKDANFLLYGAGKKGQIICGNLIKQGYSVKGFIDKNAKKIKRLLGIPVLSLEQASKKYDSHLYIVIICLWNTIDDETVAEKLYEAGFKKIIYYPNNHCMDFSLRMRNAYELVSSYEFSQVDNVPLYRYSKSEDNKIINCSKNHISFWCDIRNLFCIKRQLDRYGNENIENDIWSKYEDKPVDELWMYKNLFEYLRGNRNADINEYLEYSRPGNSKEKIQLLEVKKNTYSIYEYNRLYDPLFFIQAPVDCIYAGNGHLYIEDGYHRSTYLISCGYKMIPVIVTKKDYRKYLEDNDK